MLERRESLTRNAWNYCRLASSVLRSDVDIAIAGYSPMIAYLYIGWKMEFPQTHMYFYLKHLIKCSRKNVFLIDKFWKFDIVHCFIIWVFNYFPVYLI